MQYLPVISCLVIIFVIRAWKGERSVVRIGSYLSDPAGWKSHFRDSPGAPSVWEMILRSEEAKRGSCQSQENVNQSIASGSGGTIISGGSRGR